jgi:hypothetical protein
MEAHKLTDEGRDQPHLDEIISQFSRKAKDDKRSLQDRAMDAVTEVHKKRNPNPQAPAKEEVVEDEGVLETDTPIDEAPLEDVVEELAVEDVPSPVIDDGPINPYTGGDVEPSPEDIDMIATRTLGQAREIEPETTQMLLDITAAAGGKMEGLQYRLKGEDSLRRKIRAKLRRVPPEKVAIGDALRYTAVTDDEQYPEMVEQLISEFESRGYKVKVDDFWDDSRPAYYGTHLDLTGPNGLTFELQVHTTESIRRKHYAHEWYQISRQDELPPEVRQYANAKGVSVWQGMEKYDGDFIGGSPAEVPLDAIPSFSFEEMSPGDTIKVNGVKLRKFKDEDGEAGYELAEAATSPDDEA